MNTDDSQACHSERLKQADGLACYWLMNIPRPCHSERSEESIRMFAGGCADGFFTSFRMTNRGVYWQRSEVTELEATESSIGTSAGAHDSGSFAALRMTGFGGLFFTHYCRGIRGFQCSVPAHALLRGRTRAGDSIWPRVTPSWLMSFNSRHNSAPLIRPSSNCW